MNRTAIWVGFGFVFLVGLGVPRVQAQQPAVAEPQAPSGTLQASHEVVPALPVPRLVKFAGVLKDEQGNPRAGVMGVTFAVYKEQEGGAALWLQTQNVQLDELGHYTVLLGATKSEGLPLELFTAGEPRWLGVQVNLPREVEQPRVLLVSVPYALKAADADTLGGKPASAFVTTEQATLGPVLPSPGGTGSTSQAVAPAVSGVGNTDFLAKWVDNIGTLGNSLIFDTGTNVGIGTTNPQASLDVQLTTGGATNALNSTITLNNSSPITGSVLSAFKMTLLDQSTASNLSKQPARFVYLRDASATGGVTAFDSVMTTTSFLSADAPYPLRGVNIEGPTLATGKTLSNFTGLYVGSPGGAGTVSNKFAFVTEPNAGNVGIGTTAPTAPLEVAGNLKLSGAGNAIIFPNGTVMSSAATGVGGGTITGVTAGAGLTGGGTAGGVTLSIPNGGITNAFLAANSIGNFNIADASLSPAKITGTAATLGANSFTGNQSVAGNVLLSSNGTATSTTPANSFPLDMTGSGWDFSVTPNAPKSQAFRWQVETTNGQNGTFPTGPTSTLNLLFASGTGAPAETGLSLNGLGLVNANAGSIGVIGTAPAFNGCAGVVASLGAVGGIGCTALLAQVQNATDPRPAGVLQATAGTALVADSRTGANIAYFSVSGSPKARIDNTGKGIFDGGTQTGGADFAESFAVRGERDAYEAGDLLVIDPTQDRRLALSGKPYSRLVAGIYSTKPGVLATPHNMDSAELSSEVPLAVVGIVPCKVIAENGPIRRGDLLVTSSTPGHAMKGTNRKRMLGAVVGKALEPLPRGKGIIQVLVTLQ